MIFLKELKRDDPILLPLKKKIIKALIDQPFYTGPLHVDQMDGYVRFSFDAALPQDPKEVQWHMELVNLLKGKEPTEGS
jgi:hypothetical protein